MLYVLGDMFVQREWNFLFQCTVSFCIVKMFFVCFWCLVTNYRMKPCVTYLPRIGVIE